MTGQSWEDAVQWLRAQPEHTSLVRDSYYDDPILDAARRFVNSAEWRATLSFMPKRKEWALDLGAGRGIASYALAREGWHVTALEPDPSPLVGAYAIRQLMVESHLPIVIVQGVGEGLPFADNTFDVVYGRQVLHHSSDLSLLCREVRRVLRPGGHFIAVREHVISTPEDLTIFLARHPLHRIYGGENAYLLEVYLSAITESDLRLRRLLGPFDSPINYFPMTHTEWRENCVRPLTRRLGERMTNLFTDERHLPGQWLMARLASQLSKNTYTPGRLYSFIVQKPR